MNQTDDIQHILHHHRTVAVVGLSPKATRDSYEVAEYMQQQGWRIIPVNPAAGVEIGRASCRERVSVLV